MLVWDALRDLVTFLQFKKLEKHPFKSVTFSKERSQKRPLICFKMMLPYILNLTGNKKMRLT